MIKSKKDTVSDVTNNLPSAQRRVTPSTKKDSLQIFMRITDVSNSAHTYRYDEYSTGMGTQIQRTNVTYAHKDAHESELIFRCLPVKGTFSTVREVIALTSLTSDVV
jgi:hypothetical protein